MKQDLGQLRENLSKTIMSAFGAPINDFDAMAIEYHARFLLQVAAVPLKKANGTPEHLAKLDQLARLSQADLCALEYYLRKKWPNNFLTIAFSSAFAIFETTSEGARQLHNPRQKSLPHAVLSLVLAKVNDLLILCRGYFVWRRMQ